MSKILMAGDGWCFGGSSERILRKAMGLAGLQHEGLRYTSKLQDLPSLVAEIDKTKPNVIVALGEEALSALTNEAGIQKWRGSILPSKLNSTIKVIPSFDPEWIRRGQFQHFWSLVNDLTRVTRQSEFPEIRRPQYSNIINPGFTVARDFIDAIGNDELWSLDIETRANHVACFSIAIDTKALCIPIQNPAGPAYTSYQEAGIWQAVARLMQRNPRLVGQNLTFDLEYLFDYGLEPSGIWMDTMLSHAILYPEFPKGLDYLCSMYTEMPYYKAEGKISNPKIDLKTLHEYNNKDTIATLWCAIEIEKQLRQRGLWPVHEFVTQELSLALEMQRNRLQVDQAKRVELKNMVDESMGELDAKWAAKQGDPTLIKLAGDKVTKPNVNSPKQVASFLYGPKEEGGLELPVKTYQGKVLADETAISELKARHPGVEELEWILEERHLRKLNSSYLDVELEQDGTIGGSWCVHGTETGRWSSGKSPRGRGMNLQTVPKAVRWMVVPPTRKKAA